MTIKLQRNKRFQYDIKNQISIYKRLFSLSDADRILISVHMMPTEDMGEMGLTDKCLGNY